MKKFEWQAFYEELADKLLAYRDDHRTLLEKVVRAHQVAGVNFPKNGKAWTVDDIDPFSVLALLNRNLKVEKKIALQRAVRDEFGVEAVVPTDFSGIPHADNRKAFLFPGGPRAGEYAAGLWRMFETALAYADGKCDGGEFCARYTQTEKQYGVNRNLTMGLFWIRPEFFVNLDHCNTQFIFGSGEFASDFTEKYSSVADGCSDGAAYLFFCEALRREILSDVSHFVSFPRLSLAAYEWGQRQKIDKKLIRFYKADLGALEKRLEKMSVTERKSESVQRLGQGELRKYLLACDGCCAVTKIRTPELLVASHIKGWAESSVREQVDVENVLLLAKNYDAAFDKHLISFAADTGKILKASRISWTELGLLGIRKDAALPKPTEAQAKYLRHHLAVMKTKDGRKLS